MKKTWRIDGNIVNGPTMVVTAIARIILFLLAVIVVVAVTPLSLTQGLGLSLAFLLFVVAKTIVLTVE